MATDGHGNGCMAQDVVARVSDVVVFFNELALTREPNILNICCRLVPMIQLRASMTGTTNKAACTYSRFNQIKDGMPVPMIQLRAKMTVPQTKLHAYIAASIETTMECPYR